jgi:hypothetical protein
MLNADTCINNAYLHVLTIDNPTADKNTVKSYLLNTIKCQIIWDKSISHKQDDCNTMEYIGNDVQDDDEVSRKIAIEQRFNDQRAYIEIFRRQITCPIQRVTFECYYDKGFNSARSLSKYFGISTTSAHYMLREIKQKIREIQYSYENK